jgi:hypothetical protein
MLMRLQTGVAVVLIALMVSVWTAPSAAVGADTQQPTRRSGDAARTTVVAQPAVRDERSAPIIVLLVGLGAAAGVILGVLPAAVAATALGYLPPPPRRRRLRLARGVLAEPPPLELELERAPVAVPAPATPAALATTEDPPPHDTPRSGQLAILAHARHQDVYDSAYAEQLERVGALRSAIGDRRRTSPAPSHDPDPRPSAKGTS